MKRKTRLLLTGFTLAMLAAASGCTNVGKTTKGQETAPVVSSLSGTVVETMDGGGYTYICLEKDGKKTWAAAPVMKVKVGDKLNLQPGGEMPNFSSKTLNRTFDKIIFTSGPVQEAAAKAPAAAQGAAALAAKKSNDQPVLAGKVLETMNSGGYTYVLLEKEGKQGWAAVPTSQVKVGEEIELIPGIDMGKFSSATLKRSFDAIHFSAGIKGGKAGKAAPSEAVKEASLPEGHPPMTPADPAAAAPAAPAAPAADAISGKVVETMDAGGYTYASVEKNGQKVWVAVPSTKITVGEDVAFEPGAVMPNFTSKSLNRTFENIIFSNGRTK